MILYRHDGASKLIMIDALFSSRTRVKLLHLFLNNPGKAFYVREITRLIDEQINSVRRELANMMSVGIVFSDSSDNKLYYEVNQGYEHYEPLRQIFADTTVSRSGKDQRAANVSWRDELTTLPGLRVAIAAGTLVRGSASNIDLLLVGEMPPTRVKTLLNLVEGVEKRELNYTVMSYEDFYYRLSVRDGFILDIIGDNSLVLVDTDNVLSQERGEKDV